MQRKVVSVLFCDVVGSTALGESIDPEALQGLLARYFERMKQIVERHGGTVEKFIGDAVMAVFGVPAAHEDDALRACRAAAEMRSTFAELGVEGRIGVKTGEVVTGTEERLATGDAVNVAARLQQAAAPDEALIGEVTLELVRGAVEVEPVEPLRLKGKAEPVAAFRLVSVAEAPERSHESPFVGRDAEAALIAAALQRVLAERCCELVTVVGDAGIGKSRLVSEALEGVDVRIVRGRCPPYGEGISYWPVVEIVKQLDALPTDPAAAASIRSLLGQSGTGTSAEEIAWAFRKLLEEQAPLVVVLDDVQWGEETFLDLVDSVALLAVGAPLLLVCMARPELLDRRPRWDATLRLGPLPPHAVDELVGGRLPRDLRQRIVAAAGGNPLFLTEILAMGGGSAGVEVPPTLRALLAARLDGLDPSERRVLERGAVEGEIFHRGAVHALMPEEPVITPRLAALVHRELIRPHRPQLEGEDGFRFRHLLIRDAAYDALPKSTRAELHERFAGWIEERGTDLVELDEIVGYHLEQAARYKAELGHPDPGLAARAGEHLAAAGRRALWRVDEPAAASLLERALGLLRPFRTDVELELDLAQVFLVADPRRAAEVAGAAAERARAAGDDAGEALARAVTAGYRLDTEADGDLDDVEALARAALPLLERKGDHSGLSRVWGTLAFSVANWRCQFEEMAEAAEQSIRHAELAGHDHPSKPDFALALILGPRPADEILSTVDASLGEGRLHPPEMLLRAYILAMLGRFDEAWPLALAANERLSALRGNLEEVWLGEIARVEGDHETAGRHFRRALEAMDARGMSALAGTVGPQLAGELCALGDHEQARPLAELGRRLAAENDVMAEAGWRRALALVEAADGDHAEAERLAREAVAILAPTDALNMQGDALADLATVLAAAGRPDDAAAALEQALERYEHKKNLAMVTQIRPRLDALRERMQT